MEFWFRSKCILEYYVCICYVYCSWIETGVELFLSQGYVLGNSVFDICIYVRCSFTNAKCMKCNINISITVVIITDGTLSRLLNLLTKNLYFYITTFLDCFKFSSNYLDFHQLLLTFVLYLPYIILSFPYRFFLHFLHIW